MKRSFTIVMLSCGLLLTALLPQKAAAQGTVRFANDATSLLTNTQTGTLLPMGSNFLVALYAASTNAPESAMVRASANAVISGGPGRFDGGVVGVPGFPGGTVAQLQVRVWERAFGSNYEAAAMQPGALIGKSARLFVTLGSNTASAASLPAAGLSGTSLYPVDCLAVTCPGNITTPLGSAGGTAVSFAASVSNSCSGTTSSASVSCSPGSGSTFPMGTTIVTCTATDTSGNSNSCSFNVVVQPPTSPIVITQPESIVGTNGQSVTIGVTVLGEEPFTYTWRLNGEPIPDVTASMFTLPSVGASDAGDYDVVVVNAFGSITSLVASITVLNPTSTVAIVNTGAVWRYSFNGADLGTAWRTLDFDTRGWAGARAPLGFGNGDEQTVIGDAAHGYITAYFVRRFVLASPASVSNLVLSVRQDDGAVVYLNDLEIFRSNMPEGPVNYLTLALASAEEPPPFYFININPALLVAGTNVLAAEIHQWNSDSSDLAFDLQLLASPGGRVPLDVHTSGGMAILSWNSLYHHLQVSTEPYLPQSWTTLTNRPPVSLPLNGPKRFFRLVCP